MFAWTVVFFLISMKCQVFRHGILDSFLMKMSSMIQSESEFPKSRFVITGDYEKLNIFVFFYLKVLQNMVFQIRDDL